MLTDMVQVNNQPLVWIMNVSSRYKGSDQALSVSTSYSCLDNSIVEVPDVLFPLVMTKSSEVLEDTSGNQHKNYGEDFDITSK